MSNPMYEISTDYLVGLVVKYDILDLDHTLITGHNHISALLYPMLFKNVFIYTISLKALLVTIFHNRDLCKSLVGDTIPPRLWKEQHSFEILIAMKMFTQGR